MKEKVGKIIRYLLSMLVAVALVWFAFRGNDWKEFLQGFTDTRWWYIVLSIIAAVAALVFREERWRFQLLPLDSDIRRSSVWHGSNIGNLLNVVIPGVGEFYRCNSVNTAKAGFDRVFGTILMERSWDVLAVFLLLLLATVFNVDTIVPFMRDNVLGPFSSRFNFSIWWAVASFVVILVLAVLLVIRLAPRNKFCSMLAGWLKGMLGGFVSFSKVRKKLLFILYTVGIWLMYILMTWFTFLAVPGLEGLSLADAVFISAVGNIASVIPTPGNLGPYHYLVGLAVSTIYLGASGMHTAGLLFATLSHGSHALLIIVLGIWSYFHNTIASQNKAKQSR